jgi:3-hydroxy-3-methylglutaryl CoA synthase
MVGICSYGGYVPRYRLKREKIFESMGWLGSSGLSKGEKAVANFDEDSLTMAVAASMNCASGFERSILGGVYFASTTMPYQERQNAGIIAGALGVKENIRSADFSGALKSGTTALLAGVEAVASKGVNNLMVCSSDCRLGKAGSPQEMIIGDAAAAFIVGDKNVIAEYKGSFSSTFDFVDHYRGRYEKYNHKWEDRWIRDEGFGKLIPEAIGGFLNKYELKIQDFAKVVYPCYYPAERRKLGKKLGLEVDQIQEPMLEQIGEAGVAQP